MKLALALIALAVTTPSATDWFADEGPDELRAGAVSAFSDLSQADRAELSLAAPIPIGTISEDGIIAPETTENWISPVLLGEEAKGGMLAYLSQDDPAVEVLNDGVLGQTLVSMAGADALYRDTDLDAFFLLSNDMFRPASTSAQDYLAGEVDRESFMTLRRGLVQDGVTVAPSQPATSESSSSPVVLTLIILVACLVVTLIVTWLRASTDIHDSEGEGRKHARRARYYRGGDHGNIGD